MMRAFAFNTRRDKFKDARVRRAFNYVFDFEEMNKQFFFGQYRRVNSYFEGTELAATGLPQGEELRILEPLRDKVPPEVFTTEYANPVAGTPKKVRANLREGMRLMKEAGYEVRDHKQVNARTGEVLSVYSSVTSDPTGSERFVAFYRPALARLGIDVTVRNVDDVQDELSANFNFYIIIATWPQALTPGNEQRDIWTTLKAADTPGSRNYVGMKDPAVDALVERVIFAKSRGELVVPPGRSTACCCGTTTSCRNSPTTRYRSRAGTARPARLVARIWRRGIPERVVVTRKGRPRPDLWSPIADHPRQGCRVGESARRACGLLPALRALPTYLWRSWLGPFEVDRSAAFACIIRRGPGLLGGTHGVWSGMPVSSQPCSC